MRYRKFMKASAIGFAAALWMAMPARADTWQQTAEGWILTDDAGNRKTGWQQESGTWYYLGEDGIMRTGWQFTDGFWYYLDDSGAMRTGWTKVSDTLYFLMDSGAMRTEPMTSDEAYYCFRSDGSLNYARKQKNQGGGAYVVDFFDDDVQDLADRLNDMKLESNEDEDNVDDDDEDDYDRGEGAITDYDRRRAYRFDGVLQRVAEHRLDAAIANGYQGAENGKIPGEGTDGTVEEYLDSIGSHYRTRRHLEIYLRKCDDASSAADRVERRFPVDRKDELLRASYFRIAGIAEREVHGRHYYMIELFR